jgi:hypothetical protein
MQASGSWDISTCCEVDANLCDYHRTYCHDQTSDEGFIFRLEPGQPQRYMPIPVATGGDAKYQKVVRSQVCLHSSVQQQLSWHSLLHLTRSTTYYYYD